LAGDICHQPKGELISRKLDIRLIESFGAAPCPIAAILGNHDKDRDRIESIGTHPLGTLVASRLITLVHWPDYMLVGENPKVLITGRQYTVDGPADWLEFLKTSQALNTLRSNLEQESGVKVLTLVMTHCNWGPNDGNAMGDVVLGHHRVLGTGIDLMFYGHPHTDDGITQLDDGDRVVRIVGPGAFTRGTIAESDVKREPKVMVSFFHQDGTIEVLTPAIPHEPAEQVFDMEEHSRVKRVRDVTKKFVQTLQALDVKGQTIPEILEEVKSKTSPSVLERCRYYCSQAEASID
jgi:DNA repair exonuclease SbcCD nuclease subunit